MLQFNFKQYNFKASEDKRLRGLWSIYDFFFYFFYLVYGMYTCKLVGVCVHMRLHLYVHGYRCLRLRPGISLDPSSALSIEEGSLNQTQRSPVCLVSAVPSPTRTYMGSGNPNITSSTSISESTTTRAEY